MGNHSLKFGFSVRRDCCKRINPEAPNVAYSSRADFTNTYGNGDYKAKMYQIGGFAQNDWRVRKNLTLNLGLRYDYFSHLVPEPGANAPLTGVYNPDGLLG